MEFVKFKMTYYPRFCLGIRIVVDLEKEVFYWNPQTRSFERNAEDCWFPANQLKKMEREFAQMIPLQLNLGFSQE